MVGLVVLRPIGEPEAAPSAAAASPEHVAGLDRLRDGLDRETPR
jgi:hypothetical protein